ncbi:MAG: glycosyltransferase [Candidatus Gracilibacteria bacterium]|nr:glycosyltransferase [Candidatus Gracilibacteria bacterium]
MNLNNKKIAIVCDWIKDWGGAELVLADIMEVFPQADIFSSIFFQEGNKVFEGRKITTSFIQKIPILNKSHKLALTLRPLAFESFDLSEYDIVISSTSAESKGVITKPECLQICYCHTPTRYFWSHTHEYLNMMEFGVFNFIGKWFAPKVFHKLRQWDFCAAQRPDYFIGNSKNTVSRINKYYRREAEVIYPGTDLSKFKFNEKKEDFYLYVGRCIPYKKFDLIVDSFNENGKKIIIVTNTDNNLYRELKAKSNKNIEWKLKISRKETLELFSRAKAFLFPPEEDFGLVPVEAMACGTPVIAYGKGGATETVLDGKTGIYFQKQTVKSLNKAIEKFENTSFNYKEIREHSQNFSKEKFQQNLLKFVEDKLNNFR